MKIGDRVRYIETKFDNPENGIKLSNREGIIIESIIFIDPCFGIRMDDDEIWLCYEDELEVIE